MSSRIPRGSSAIQGAGHLLPRPSLGTGSSCTSPTHQFVSPVLIVLQRDAPCSAVELQAADAAAVKRDDQDTMRHEGVTFDGSRPVPACRGGPGPGGSHPRCFAIHPPRRALGRRPCVACRRGATGAAAQGPPRGDPRVGAVRRVVDRCAHPISVRGCPWTRRGPVCRAGPARLKPRRYALQGWRAGRRSVRPTGAACGPRTKSGGARPPVPARRRPNGCVRQGWWSKHRSFRPASAGCRPWTTRGAARRPSPVPR